MVIFLHALVTLVFVVRVLSAERDDLEVCTVSECITCGVVTKKVPRSSCKFNEAVIASLMYSSCCGDFFSHSGHAGVRSSCSVRLNETMRTFVLVL